MCVLRGPCSEHGIPENFLRITRLVFDDVTVSAAICAFKEFNSRAWADMTKGKLDCSEIVCSAFNNMVVAFDFDTESKVSSADMVLPYSSPTFAMSIPTAKRSHVIPVSMSA